MHEQVHLYGYLDELAAKSEHSAWVVGYKVIEYTIALATVHCMDALGTLIKLFNSLI